MMNMHGISCGLLVFYAAGLVVSLAIELGGAASDGILQRLTQAHAPDQIEARGSHRVVRRAVPPYSDPKYQRQKWYYSEDPTVDRKAGLPSIRVEGAWAQGVTGRGVFVMVVDDGVDANPELAGNVDTSKGLNISTGAADSSSPYAVSHGTQVASIIAANDNNGLCGVGVAPDVTISGVVLPFGGEIPDASVGQALNHRLSEVDIYSNSWGSSEQTSKLDIMGPLASRAVVTGSMEGRNGKGSIYVWAASNGGLNMNYCSYNGYIQQRYVIPVTGLHHTGRRLSSTERCSAVMVTTYSSSGSDTVEIVSTHDETGTCPGDVYPGISDSSAAAPFVAGAVALALDANDALGWRDIHHLIVESSNSNIDVTPDDWLTNAAGKKVSPTFGFGLLDVERMVANALRWNTVPEQVSCDVTAQGPSRPIPAEISANVYDVMDCREIAYLEKVQVFVDLNFTYRGHIGLELTSPSGTTSVLLPGRFRDTYNRTLVWSATSVHFWGEPATKGTNGVWKLNFIRKFTDRMPTVVSSGNLYNWRLSLYGTKVPPTFPVLPTTTPPATPTSPMNSALGFGVMNAGKMVRLAKVWSPVVPPATSCLIESPRRTWRIPYQGEVSIPIRVPEQCRIDRLEHVEVVVDLTFTRRGHVKASLSHGRMESVLLPGRLQDVYNTTLDNWRVVSVHFWGKDPRTDEWTLKLANAYRQYRGSGVLRSWKVVMYGTAGWTPTELPSRTNRGCTVNHNGRPISDADRTPARPLFPSVHTTQKTPFRDDTGARPSFHRRHIRQVSQSRGTSTVQPTISSSTTEVVTTLRNCSNTYTQAEYSKKMVLELDQYTNVTGMLSESNCRGRCNVDHSCLSFAYNYNGSRCSLNKIMSNATKLEDISPTQPVYIYDRICSLITVVSQRPTIAPTPGTGTSNTGTVITLAPVETTEKITRTPTTEITSYKAEQTTSFRTPESHTTPEPQTTTQSQTRAELQVTTQSQTTPELQATTQSQTTPELQTTTQSQTTSELQTTTQSQTTPEPQTTTQYQTTPEPQITTQSQTTSELQTTTQSQTTPDLQTTTQPKAKTELQTSTQPIPITATPTATQLRSTSEATTTTPRQTTTQTQTTLSERTTPTSGSITTATSIKKLYVNIRIINRQFVGQLYDNSSQAYKNLRDEVVAAVFPIIVDTLSDLLVRMGILTFSSVLVESTSVHTTEAPETSTESSTGVF